VRRLLHRIGAKGCQFSLHPYRYRATMARFALSKIGPFKINQLRTVRAWAPCPLVTKGPV
jgi:hypothetical protein